MMSRWILLLPAALGAAALVWAASTLWPGSQPDVPAETSYAELVRHLERQPRDGRALVFKARQDMQAQRFEGAATAYQQALQGTPNVARDPNVWVEYAEARAMAQGGTLVGQPEQLLEQALTLDARHAQALDLAGSAAWEKRDFAQAARYWTRLLEQTPPGSPRHPALTAAIERAASHARVSLPPQP